MRRRSPRVRTGRLCGGAGLVGRRSSSGWVARLRDESGAAMFEFAIVGSLLLMMVLGVIEFGNVYSAVHNLTSLSREGANLAARGATLSEALNSVMTNGADMKLTQRGGAVVSRIAVQNGTARIEDQVATPGYASRHGTAGGDASNVAGWQLDENQTVYAVEIFYRYDAVTPFEGAFGIGVPDTLYEAGIF
jgi:Flp pilus assembly pilin Flp